MNNAVIKTLKLDCTYRPLEVIDSLEALILCIVGKAIAVGDKPATGLPELGTTGLGMTAGLFGADIKL